MIYNMSRFLTEVLLSMSKKNVKYLIIAGIAVDTVLTIGLFVLSIVLLVHFNTTTQAELLTEEGFLGWFVKDPNRIIYTVMVPLFILLALNIVLLFLYVKKTAPKREKVELNELSDEQKEALRKELLKDISKENESK